jgi:3'(2'), 5'-bisphosphate nucleotidase
MIGKATNILVKAGKILEKYWNKPLKIDTKTDGSYVTNADLEVNEFLIKNLENEYSVPVISEESLPDWEIRKNYRDYWLIDPLDGTHEYVAKFGDFCICLAYIRGKRPICGFVYAPALDEMYVAIKGAGVTFFKKNHKEKLVRPLVNKLIVALSRFHPDALVAEFCKNNGIKPSLTIGAALKFCKIATGAVTVYPRFHGPKEWDIAAGDLIVQESGGRMFSLATQEKLLYNNQDLRVDPFIAFGHGVKDQQFIYPDVSNGSLS